MMMNIVLEADTKAYLEAQVAAGRFLSLSDAVEALARADAARGSDQEAEDLAWTKPYLDRGLDDLQAGRVTPSADVHAGLRRRFTSGH